jgi:hypothetical protein
MASAAQPLQLSRIQVAKYMIDKTMLWREDVRIVLPDGRALARRPPRALHTAPPTAAHPKSAPRSLPRRRCSATSTTTTGCSKMR